MSGAAALAAESNWPQNEYFKLLGQVQGNAINICDFFYIFFLLFVISVKGGHCYCSRQKA